MPELIHVANRQPLRILVLSKRQYMARDLIDERYGRFRELPMAMAALGASCRGLCLSYRKRTEGESIDAGPSANVAWSSLNARRLLSAGSRGYWRELDHIRDSFRPDVVWACSDVPHAILGVAAARRLTSRLIIDLFDNFESYPLSRVPGVNAALRRAIHRADGVTCVSSPLSRRVREVYGFQGPVATIENAIPEGVFQPRDKQISRREFGLPPQGLLIGTAGALTRGRGIHLLLEAFGQLAPRFPQAHLVLAGPLDGSISIPDDPNIHYLGLLAPDAVPRLLPALDVSVVANRDSTFGRYCFPQKLYESLACGLPVAVARVGAMIELLRECPGNLYDPNDAASLRDCLASLCTMPRTPDLAIPTWNVLGGNLLAFLGNTAALRPIQA